MAYSENTNHPWDVRAAWAKQIVANMQPRVEPDRSVPAINNDHVYLAYSAGRIKIGTSMDVGVRKRGLNTQSPHPVTIILTIPGDCKLERKLHFCLGGVRVHGEWFKITPEMRELLAASLCRTGLRKFKKAEADFRKWVRTEYAGI
jgi:Meiotically Up-regulated Gene 113 (MUG113) protein